MKKIPGDISDGMVYWPYSYNPGFPFIQSISKRIREPHEEYTGPIKEDNTMKVEYNGFTGDMVKLERTFNGVTEIPVDLPGNPYHKWFYTLSIYDSEKRVTHTFEKVKLDDIKFFGGAVSFG